MPDSLLPDSVSPGDPIKADVFTRLLRIGKIFNQEPGQFNSGTISVQRQLGFGGANLADLATDIAILFKDINAATFDVAIGDPITETEIQVTPSALVTECVAILTIPDDNTKGDTEKTPADPLENEKDENDDAIVYDAVNYCWWTAIKAGDGKEQTTGEPPEGTGIYNEPPVIVRGFTRNYGEIPEGETEPVAKKYFGITNVLNPCIIYAATLNTALATTDATVEVTPVGGIWGRPPQGTRTVDNSLNWAGDNGAAAIVLRGVDSDILLNLECPASP
jgi:hypothetical protein